MRGIVMRFLFLFLTLLYLAFVLVHLAFTGEAAAPAARAAPVAQAAAPASRFTIIDVGEIPASERGRRVPGATALNDRGQVVGGFGHAFLWDGGHARDLGTLPPHDEGEVPDSMALAVNDGGQIVGTSGTYGPVFNIDKTEEVGFIFQSNVLRQLTKWNISFEPRAINAKGQIVGLNFARGFFHDAGHDILFDTLSRLPAGNFSIAQSINSQGQVVGWSTAPGPEEDPGLPVHAFLWQRKGKPGDKSGRMRDLGTLPGWANSYACGINDRGEVVGTISHAPANDYNEYDDLPTSDCRAFLWRAGKMASLGTLPGGDDSEAAGINNGGAVVGRSGKKAFLWESGTMRDLNALIPADSSWALSEARAINNKGQIAGNGTLGGQPHAFLLTPR